MELRETEEYLEEIDLLEYVALFWRQKWIIFFIFNITVFGALVHTFFIADEVYQSQTSTMPLKSSGGGSLSALRSLVPSGLVNLPMNKGEEDLNRFINIIQSRMITEEVINSLDLVTQLYPKIPDDKKPDFQEVIKKVQELISATDNRKGLLIVTAKAHSPQALSS